MRRLLYIPVFLLGVGQLAIAQDTGQLNGIVKSAEGPVEFLNVGLKGTNIGDLTDEQGLFSLAEITPGSYELEISGLGYQSKTIAVSIREGLNESIDIEIEESALGLDEVVVVSGTMKEISKKDSPVPVEVYSPLFFQKNPTSNIYEGLQNVNGVRPQLNCNVCNTGDIHINGLEGPYSMILLDGMPIVSGLSTVYGLSGIPNSLVERMEIVKGSASALYGSEAVGGLINIITKVPGNAPKLSLNMFGTSWAEYNTDLGMKFNAGSKATSLLGINYFNYNNPIDNNQDGFTDVTQQNRISIFNKWDFKRSNNYQASLAGRYFYEDRWGGQINWTPAYRGGNEIYAESIYTERIELVGNYQLPIKERVTLNGSFNRHLQNSVYGDLPFNADQRIAFGQMIWDKEFSKHNLLSGVTYRYTFYDDDTPATEEGDHNSPDRVKLPGVFLQDEITFNKQQKILLGFRYDHDSRHGNIWSPRLAYKWSPNDENIVRFNFGTGFRVVNLFTEEHAALTGARDVVIAEKLAPEQSYNWSLNYVKKYYLGQSILQFDLSGWYTYFTNKIIPDYETDPNLILYDNLDGNAVSRGISLNADFISYSPFKAMVGMTVMDVSNTERNAADVMETTRQILTERVTGTWALGYSFYELGLSIDYTGNLYGPMRLPLLGELDPRDEFSPVWSIQNIKITKKFGEKWEIYGGIKNLLNFTPAANAIARSFDPFDKKVEFDANGDVIPTQDNPYALTFDPSYVYAPNQGIRGFMGFRWIID